VTLSTDYPQKQTTTERLSALTMVETIYNTIQYNTIQFIRIVYTNIQ